MRIISGNYRGKNIIAPTNLPSRPTTDFAKEALFNILRNRYYLEEVSVMDLFAGTGNISYEFISRGCKSLVAVDQNYNCYKFIKSTIEKLNFHYAQTVKADVFSFLETCNRKFDIVFADPPYDMEGIEKIPELVFKNNLLAENGILILEHSKETKLDEVTHFIEKRKYGNINFSFFEIN